MVFMKTTNPYCPVPVSFGTAFYLPWYARLWLLSRRRLCNTLSSPPTMYTYVLGYTIGSKRLPEVSGALIRTFLHLLTGVLLPWLCSLWRVSYKYASTEWLGPQHMFWLLYLVPIQRKGSTDTMAFRGLTAWWCNESAANKGQDLS
mgnify:CR=1 FL=1